MKRFHAKLAADIQRWLVKKGAPGGLLGGAAAKLMSPKPTNPTLTPEQQQSIAQSRATINQQRAGLGAPPAPTGQPPAPAPAPAPASGGVGSYLANAGKGLLQGKGLLPSLMSQGTPSIKGIGPAGLLGGAAGNIARSMMPKP